MKRENKFREVYGKGMERENKFREFPYFSSLQPQKFLPAKISSLKVTFAPNLAKKLNSLFYQFNLLFQLSVVNPENFKEINA